MKSTGCCALQPAVVELNGQLGACAAMPHRLNDSRVCSRSTSRTTITQQRAQKLLSVLVGRGASVPDRADISREPPQRLPLSVREQRWPLPLEIWRARRRRSASVNACSSAGSSVRARSRFSGSPASNWRWRRAGLNLGLLDGELSQLHALLVFGLGLIDRAGRSLGRRRDRPLAGTRRSPCCHVVVRDRLARTAGSVGQVGPRARVSDAGCRCDRSIGPSSCARTFRSAPSPARAPTLRGLPPPWPLDRLLERSRCWVARYRSQVT